MPEDMPDRMPEGMPDRMPDKMSDRKPDKMSDRKPEDLPVTKFINVMVGITRSKVIFEFLTCCTCCRMIIRGGEGGGWGGCIDVLDEHFLYVTEDAQVAHAVV